MDVKRDMILQSTQSEREVFEYCENQAVPKIYGAYDVALLSVRVDTTQDSDASTDHLEGGPA